MNFIPFHHVLILMIQNYKWCGNPFPCMQDGNSGDDFNKEGVERDERRLTELGRRTVEIFVLAHIFRYYMFDHRVLIMSFFLCFLKCLFFPDTCIFKNKVIQGLNIFECYKTKNCVLKISCMQSNCFIGCSHVVEVPL